MNFLGRFVGGIAGRLKWPTGSSEEKASRPQETKPRSAQKTTPFPRRFEIRRPHRGVPPTIRTRVRNVEAIYAAKTKSPIVKPALQPKRARLLSAPFERLFKTPGSMLRKRKLGKIFEHLGTTVKTSEIEACAKAHDSDALAELFKEARRRSRLKRAGKPYQPGQMAKAANRVFEIEELCEMIMLHLPPRDAIVARRICKLFAKTFEGSQELKTMVFLRPAPRSSSSSFFLNKMMLRPSIGPRYIPSHIRGQYQWLQIIGFRSGSRMELREEDLAGKMLVMQPSVSSMQIFLQYDTDWDRCIKLGGDLITVRDVLKASRTRSTRRGYKAVRVWVGIEKNIRLV